MHEIDQAQLRRANDRVASRFDEADFFCSEARQRLLERLRLTTLKPRVIVDLGAGTGAATGFLKTLYPDALIVAVDWSAAMLREAGQHAPARVCADAHQLPLADGTADIVVSNLMLPGAANPPAVFAEVLRVLRSPGLYLFNTLGPDTLRELRQAWAQVDEAPHVQTFTDMHNTGDALVQAGFREPVMDVESMDISYTDIGRLFADLRAVAATNLLLNRRRGLTTPRLWRRLMNAAERTRGPDGKLHVHVELVTGQAWAGAPPAGVQMTDGEARFPISGLRRYRMRFDEPKIPGNKQQHEQRD